MNRRQLLALPLVLLVPAAGRVTAAEAPEVSVYLNPN